MTRTQKLAITLLGTIAFFGWLWSGWQYLTGHVPFKVWDDNMVSAIPEG